jgi:lipopolysaccharide biosynthesis regulator YciM
VTFAESFFLLFLIVIVAGGAYYYVQKRERVQSQPITPYADGLRALLDGDAVRAMHKLRETVAADSGNLDAYIRLGRLLADTNDLPKAIKIHRLLAFRADLTSNQKADVYRALAEDYIKAGDQSRVLEALEHILTISKKDRWALERKLDLHVQQQDWERASETAERLNQAGGNVSPRFMAVLKLQEGLKLCSDKKERDGRIQFREAIKHDSTFAGPYLYWGDSYIRENRIEDAIKIWKRLLEVNPARAHILFDRLETYLFDLGKFSEVEDIYRTLTRTHPENVHAWAALSKFLVKRGDRGDSLAVLHEGLLHNPESIWLRRRLIQQYGEVRDVDRVLSVSREILSRVMKEGYDYRCSNCGHVSPEPLWSCPQCKQLDTFDV